MSPRSWRASAPGAPISGSRPAARTQPGSPRSARARRRQAVRSRRTLASASLMPRFIRRGRSRRSQADSPTSSRMRASRLAARPPTRRRLDSGPADSPGRTRRAATARLPAGLPRVWSRATVRAARLRPVRPRLRELSRRLFPLRPLFPVRRRARFSPLPQVSPASRASLRLRPSPRLRASLLLRHCPRPRLRAACRAASRRKRQPRAPASRHRLAGRQARRTPGTPAFRLPARPAPGSRAGWPAPALWRAALARETARQPAQRPLAEQVVACRNRGRSARLAEGKRPTVRATAVSSPASRAVACPTALSSVASRTARSSDGRKTARSSTASRRTARSSMASSRTARSSTVTSRTARSTERRRTAHRNTKIR